MFELKDSLGRPLFESIVICLVCDDCMKTDHPERCTHKLAEMPRWLSSNKMETVKSLLADDPVNKRFPISSHTHTPSPNTSLHSNSRLHA